MITLSDKSPLLLLPLALALGSCLDFDMPGDTFKDTEKNVQAVTTRGRVDSIDYRTPRTTQEVRAALADISEHLQASSGSQFAMRGGKQGETPGPHAYQFQFSLGADVYSGYFVTPHTDFIYGGFSIPTSYAIEPKCYGGAMGSFRGETAKALVPLLNHPKVDVIPELKAMGLLLFDYAAIEVADIYGPMPFSDIKTNKQTYPFTYESVEQIYSIVEANIDTIVRCFEHYPSKPLEYRTLVDEALYTAVQCFDESWDEETGFKNDLETPRRFANSLKLRMAMHIVKADPSRARRWAEEAVASGVIETRLQEVALWPDVIGFTHPLTGITEWGDTCLSASLECVLRAYDHPFLHTAFAPNSGDIHNARGEVVVPAGTRVVGILTGDEVGGGQAPAENDYVSYSGLKNFEYAPLYLMKLSEVCFLRAEGALRGWQMGGTAAEWYEKGIRNGNFADPEDDFDQALNQAYDQAMHTYLQREKAIPYTYEDPKGNTEPLESPIKVGVRWNEADPREVKLEKIITQKYLAGFPYSFEAWTDLRRTGYPRLLPVLNIEDCDGSLQEDDIIRRLPFPDRLEPSVQYDIATSGLPALGGPDVAGTRLWWDVDAPNF